VQFLSRLPTRGFKWRFREEPTADCIDHYVERGTVYSAKQIITMDPRLPSPQRSPCQEVQCSQWVVVMNSAGRPDGPVSAAVALLGICSRNSRETGRVVTLMRHQVSGRPLNSTEHQVIVCRRGHASCVHQTCIPLKRIDFFGSTEEER